MGWERASGAVLFEFLRGVSYNKNEASDQPFADSVAILRAGNLQGGRIQLDDLVYVPSRRVSSEQYLKRGDFVIAMSSGSASVVGKVSYVDADIERASFGAFCGVLRPRKPVWALWLRLFFQSSSYREAIRTLAAGININNLRASHLLDLEIPFPPLSEQHRITARVEELQARSRCSRRALEAIPPLLEKLRQSVLASAFRGELTADWRARNPAVEPASVLLERIRVERRRQWEEAELVKMQAKGVEPKNDHWKQRYEEPESVDTSELPELPEGWAWVPIGLLGQNALATVQTGPFGAQLHSSDFVSEGIPVIAVGNLTGLGFSSEKLYFITPEKAQQLGRYDVQAGDLLFARSGATLGKVCVAPEYVRDWRMTGHILRARLNRKFVIPQPVAFALWGSPVVESQVTSRIRGMTRPGYNTSLLESIAVPVAPIEEQKALQALIAADFTRVDQIGFTVSEIVRDLARADQSILAKAFRGELVPQDPDDEPASVLLERIRAEREREDPRPRRGRKPARPAAP